MISSSTNIRVRFAETDAMRVAYHGNYFAWFEAARIDMLDAMGLPYRELDAMGLYLPVLEVGAKYLHSAHFDDILTIKASIRERPGVIIKIEYEVFCGEKKLCEAFSKHAFVNEKGVPIKPPADFLRKLRELFDKNE